MQVRMHCLLFCWIFASLVSAPFTARGESIAFVFSGSANGIVRSCHCPSAPWGGLAKRAWLIDSIRATTGSNGLTVVDTGDLFAIDAASGQSALMLKLMHIMDYDAIAIGDQEFRDGLDAWHMVHRKAGQWDDTFDRPDFPWLSGGYTFSDDVAGQMAAVPSWKIFEQHGVRIGIVSIVGAEAWRFISSKPKEISLTDPVDMIEKYLEENRSHVDFSVVLSHQGLDADRELAARIKDIDLIIGGHSQSLLSPPEVVNGIAICQAGKNGENLGILIISPRKASTLPADPNREVKTNVSENKVSDVVKNPFLSTLVKTPRWRIAQHIIPLTTAIEDSESAAALINEYYAKTDAKNAKRLAVPDARSETDVPQLVLCSLPEPLVMEPGSTQTVDVCISNKGGVPLVIERVRSKSPWMTVKDAPSRIEPDAEATIRLEIAAVKIDRFFRCEFTLLANDPLRRVIIAGFPGKVVGEMPGILDVPSMMADLAILAAGPKTDAVVFSPDRTKRASATDLSAVTNMPIHKKVRVEYYYSPGCPECREVARFVLPAFTNQFANVVDFQKRDVNIPENYVRLARLQERLGVRSNEPVSMYVDDTIPILGLSDIQASLIRIVTERLDRNGIHQPNKRSEKTVADTSTTLSKTNGDGNVSNSTPPDVLAKRLRTFTIPAIIAAGLVDGINPCAFATIVFFISLLGVSGVKGGRILLVGTGYTLAVFTTYLLMGFGAFHLLQTLQGLHIIAEALRGIMIVVLLLLGVLSARDAWVFKHHACPDDVTLQLPAKLKRRMHDIMRTHLRSGSLFISALTMGILVTLIESVCTGQVYLPTLVMLSRYAETRMKAFSLLVLYNFMFVVPLILLIAAAFIGTRTPKFVAWSKHNVIWGKILMAVLFLTLAATLIVL